MAGDLTARLWEANEANAFFMDVEELERWEELQRFYDLVASSRMLNELLINDLRI